MALALQNQDETYSGVERTAILVMYLERGLAKALLDLMNDEEVRKVGMAMASIDRVDAPDIERIVGDFVRELYEVSLMPRTGPEFVNKVLPELLEDERRETILPILKRRVNTEFADFISNRPPKRWRRSWRMSIRRPRPSPWRSWGRTTRRRSCDSCRKKTRVR